MSEAVFFGGQSMVGELQYVLVKQPDQNFGNADCKTWHYTEAINLSHAKEEHEALVRILQAQGAKIFYHFEDMPALADSIFVHDPVLMTDFGAVLLRMAKPLRQGEEQFMQRKLEELKIPILATIREPGLVEGGDLIWLDHRTLLAGRGYRTNLPGILQLRELLQMRGIATFCFDLPHDQGKQACLHLQSLISLIDVNLAVVYLPLLPAALVELLEKRGYELIPVTEEEFQNMGPNVLSLKPRVVLMLDRNPSLKKRLEAKGVEVHTYRGEEISIKAEGGPSCLTRPLKRAKLPDTYGPTYG